MVDWATPLWVGGVELVPIVTLRAKPHQRLRAGHRSVLLMLEPVCHQPQYLHLYSLIFTLSLRRFEALAERLALALLGYLNFPSQLAPCIEPTLPHISNYRVFSLEYTVLIQVRASWSYRGEVLDVDVIAK